MTADETEAQEVNTASKYQREPPLCFCCSLETGLLWHFTHGGTLHGDHLFTTLSVRRQQTS